MTPPKDLHSAEIEGVADGPLPVALDTPAADADRAASRFAEQTPRHSKPVPPRRAAPRRSVAVSDIVRDGLDASDEKITRVFFKRKNYAVYAVSYHVKTHFSDDDAEADKQFSKLAPLFRLRDRLEYLKQDLKCRGDYQLQIANAFRIGLQGDVDEAAAILRSAIRNATEKRARTGRIVYLAAAGVVTTVFAMLLCALGAWLVSGTSGPQPLGLLVLATGGGALGAFLSIAMAIRTRTVAPDGHFWTNAADGGLRVVIGVLAGGALLLLITSGLVTNPFASSATGAAPVGWQAALIVGFVAGFLERLVPDILEKREPFVQTPAEKAGTTEPG